MSPDLPALARKAKAAQQRGQAAWAERDALVCAMRDQGASLRWIAEAVGLSHQAISKIVERRRDG